MPPSEVSSEILGRERTIQTCFQIGVEVTPGVFVRAFQTSLTVVVVSMSCADA